MITVNLEDFHTALSFLRDIIPNNPHIQTFSFVYIEACDNSTVKLRGMDIGKYAEILVDVEATDGVFHDVLIPMDKLYGFISEIKKISAAVVITTNGYTIEMLLDDKSTAKINGIDPKDFPDRPSYKIGTNNLVVSSTEMSKAVGMAKLTSPQFVMTQSIHLYTNGKDFVAEATTGFSGGKSKVTEFVGDTPQFDITVPADVDRTILKMAKLYSGDWNILITEKHLIIEIPSHCLVSYSLVNEKYLNLSSMYTNSSVTHFSVDAGVFRTNLNIIKVLSEVSTVSIEVKDNVVRVFSGEDREYCVDVNPTQDNYAKLSIKELEGVLNMIEGDTFHFQFGKNEPVLIFGDDITKKFFILTQ